MTAQVLERRPDTVASEYFKIVETKPKSEVREEPVPLLVSLAQHPGVTRVLQEVEKQQRGKWYEMHEFIEGIRTRRIIPDENKGIVIGAWDSVAHVALLNALNSYCPNVPRRILWTSPTAQTEFAQVEIDYVLNLKRLLDAGRIQGIWFGSRDWMNFFPDDKKTFFAPYPIFLRRKHDVPALSDKSDVLEIGLLGPMHPRKNMLQQLAAVKQLGARVHFTAMDRKLTEFCKAFGIPYTDHGWLDPFEYSKLVASLDAGLQVSHMGVESRSYVLVDFLMQDVPCLSSVEWAPPELRCTPDDIHRMDQALRARTDPATRKSGQWRNFIQQYAHGVNIHFNQKWTEVGL